MCQETKKVSIKICRKDRKIKYNELKDYQGILGEEKRLSSAFVEVKEHTRQGCDKVFSYNCREKEKSWKQQVLRST